MEGDKLRQPEKGKSEGDRKHRDVEIVARKGK